MEKITLGLIREGKVPADKRVPLTPKQCLIVQEKFPFVKIKVQRSEVRSYLDHEYSDLGIEVVDNLNDCDIILGVKEVNKEDLLPNKRYMFFSHTIKKQPYNRELLKTILDRKIQLTDYEVLKDKNNKRIIGFGRYAGVVGAYNALMVYGKKTGAYELKPANQCENRKEMEAELKKVQFPAGMRLVLTGFGRVGHGAREIMDLVPLTEVSPEEFLNQDFNEPVFTHLDVEDYYARRDGAEFVKSDFYANAHLYESVFGQFAKRSDVYIACHFWSNRSPNILTNVDLLGADRLKVVADISCDIAGPIACTIRSSKIADPIYGYDPKTEKEVEWDAEGAIAVMAVDNLPCELPKDASEDFGNELIKVVFPVLFGEDPDNIIARGTETSADGKLTEYFAYLQDYVDGDKVSH